MAVVLVDEVDLLVTRNQSVCSCCRSQDEWPMGREAGRPCLSPAAVVTCRSASMFAQRLTEVKWHVGHSASLCMCQGGVERCRLCEAGHARVQDHCTAILRLQTAALSRYMGQELHSSKCSSSASCRRPQSSAGPARSHSSQSCPNLTCPGRMWLKHHCTGAVQPVRVAYAARGQAGSHCSGQYAGPARASAAPYRLSSGLSQVGEPVRHHTCFSRSLTMIQVERNPNTSPNASS